LGSNLKRQVFSYLRDSLVKFGGGSEDEEGGDFGNNWKE